MSTNQTRRPSAASETFITALAALFFISLAALFLWIDEKKDPTKEVTEQKHFLPSVPDSISPILEKLNPVVK